MRNEFTAIVECDEEWYTAYCPEIPGANGQGNSREECQISLTAATALILENRREDTLRGIPEDEIYNVVVMNTDTEEPDPKSQQINKVFAHYGRALFLTQCIERDLAILLATKYGPGPEKITKTQYNKLFEKTLESLVGDLSKTVSITLNLESSLVEARNKRNWLTHNYF
jgi:predicted RNase H-like HicB family nuclease